MGKVIKAVKTYSCKEVLISIGAHAASGFAEDSFITIDENGEGIVKKVGCDGEVTRSMSPDRTYNVKISLDQMSSTNSFLNTMQMLDKETGAGIFPILVTDLKGAELFSADQAWVSKSPSRVWGKTSQNREWEISTGDGTFIDI